MLSAEAIVFAILGVFAGVSLMHSIVWIALLLITYAATAVVGQLLRVRDLPRPHPPPRTGHHTHTSLPGVSVITGTGMCFWRDPDNP